MSDSDGSDYAGLDDEEIQYMKQIKAEEAAAATAKARKKSKRSKKGPSKRRAASAPGGDGEEEDLERTRRIQALVGGSVPGEFTRGLTLGEIVDLVMAAKLIQRALLRACWRAKERHRLFRVLERQDDGSLKKVPRKCTLRLEGGEVIDLGLQLGDVKKQHPKSRRFEKRYMYVDPRDQKLHYVASRPDGTKQSTGGRCALWCAAMFGGALDGAVDMKMILDADIHLDDDGEEGEAARFFVDVGYKCLVFEAEDEEGAEDWIAGILRWRDYFTLGPEESAGIGKESHTLKKVMFD